jgi:hypothetical protein
MDMEGKMSDTGKTKWREDETIRRGKDAAHLAETHRSVLEPRLPAGAIDGLRTDLALLTVSKADRKAGKTEQKGRTGKKRDAAEDGKDWVLTVRTMAKRTDGVSKGELKALGVGEPLSAKSSHSVTAAAEAILRAFEKNPELSRRIGLIEQDITDAQDITAELGTAGSEQSDVIIRNKDKTFDRNAVQMRIEAAVDMISTRGRMAFRNDRDVRDRFEALVSTKSLNVVETEEETAGDTADETAV